MPTSYTCDYCGQSAPSLNGWLIASINLIHCDATVPINGRVLDATLPDVLFDTADCRDAWCAAAGLAGPEQAPANA